MNLKDSKKRYMRGLGEESGERNYVIILHLQIKPLKGSTNNF